jgi:peptidoglycan/xylan/chitin deacetylase (PgdA/CDA1 family)
MFKSTGPFALFDYFRVPHERVGAESAPPGLASLSVRGQTASLSWPLEAVLRSERRRPTSYFLGTTPLFGRVAPDAEVRSWLPRNGGNWRAAEEIRNEQGTLVGAVWRNDDDGSTVLPFDPNELIHNFWSERYLEYVRPAAVSHMAGLARRGYYRARPLLPRAVQMSMRRSFSRVQSKSRFPRWPVETALHDFYDFLFATVAGVAQRPVPFIGLWPRNFAWALVLTHDVEAQVGYEKLPELLRVEVEAGYRSSWNFVPQNRYVVADGLVQTLQEQGFEVGVHGFNHDGRDLASLATLKRRLPGIRDSAERWQARGFRSPGTLRSAELMPLLGFDYDSSYTDTAPFEPQAGGCCTWLPYMIEDLVELPITLTQDHTLFDLLGHRDESVWVEKARFLRQRGGMALVLTHSDYVAQPYLLDSYRRLLREFADDSTAWKALPRDVSDWWRRRSNSSLEEIGGEWCVVGPAEKEARVEFNSLPVFAV